MTTAERERHGITVRRGLDLARWPTDVESWFDRAFKDFGMWPSRRIWPIVPRMLRSEPWVPDMDILEKDGAVTVRVDLPGVRKEDIDVAVEGDMLVIRGWRLEAKEIKEETYHYVERAAGDFCRAISLPKDARLDAIVATYRDGVLEVTVPCAAAPAARKQKIDVK